MRLWAWLAYLRHADLIRWSDALPDQDDPTAAADPSKLTWFYPGSWFGVDEPVASIQLKWLRRAAAGLRISFAGGAAWNADGCTAAGAMITRQVELRPVQAPDPEYEPAQRDGGSKDLGRGARAAGAVDFVVSAGRTSPDDPAVKIREADLNLDIVRWQEPKERPYILPRTAQWFWDDPNRSNGDKWAFLKLGVDIYNAGDSRPQQNQLQMDPGRGWVGIQTRAGNHRRVRTYWVQRFSMNARVNLDQHHAGFKKADGDHVC